MSRLSSAGPTGRLLDQNIALVRLRVRVYKGAILTGGSLDGHRFGTARNSPPLALGRTLVGPQNRSPSAHGAPDRPEVSPCSTESAPPTPTGQPARSLQRDHRGPAPPRSHGQLCSHPAAPPASRLPRRPFHLVRVCEVSTPEAVRSPGFPADRGRARRAL